MNDNFLWIIIGIMLLSSILTGIQQLRNDSKRTIKILGEIAKQIGVPETSVDDEIKNNLFICNVDCMDRRFNWKIK
jgi:hypothetical protein